MNARKVFWGALLCCVAFCEAPISACSVPVFRYALERWPADPYRVIVYHEGPLSKEKGALVQVLQKHASGYDYNSNLDVRTVDLATEAAGPNRDLWQAQPGAQLPWMVLLYPHDGEHAARAWSAPLSAENVAKLLDSPARREVTRRVLSGEAAVWVLLSCGDSEKDQAAAAVLEAGIKGAVEAIEQQSATAYPADYGSGTADEAPIVFSMLGLSRTDASEEAFVNMLLHSEEDLVEYSEPMAFPIFGRGRALYALVGKGINKDNILDGCAFLTGWCSCEVKALNPGTDMLMSADWEASLTGMTLPEDEPPLEGFSEFEGVEARAHRPAETDNRAAPKLTPATYGATKAQPEIASGGLMRNVVVVVLAALAVVALGTYMVVMRKGQ